MFNINNEDQVNDNDNNIFLSDAIIGLVADDNEINDNMKLLIFNKDM
jgi:hypothetical protein